MTNILYVEDNEDNIYMLSKRLKKKGFDITIAKDGEEGLKAARGLKPDLILMDLSLPLLDGWEATRILKSEPETKRIPIIVLSAHAMQVAPSSVSPHSSATRSSSSLSAQSAATALS